MYSSLLGISQRNAATVAKQSFGKYSFATIWGRCVLSVWSVPRGYLEDNWGDPDNSWRQFLRKSSDIQVIRNPGDYKRSACEDVKCELKALFEVCDSVRLNTRRE
jgi:hypothetical protein